MEIYDIGIILCENPGYSKSQFSPLSPNSRDNLGMTEIFSLSSN